MRFDSAAGRSRAVRAHPQRASPATAVHHTKTIGFGPDGWLYLSQGSTCNVCIEKDPRRATMMRMHADGTQAEIYATGLRNSVGFDWAPWDGALYATENGRDLLGDDFPPDELNRIEPGRFYGWPYVNGFGVLDPDSGPRGTRTRRRDDRARCTASVRTMRRSASQFLRAPNPPPGYERTAIVALHGSWNRSPPDGYKVVALHWQADGTIVESDFLTGFLGPRPIIGRPAGVVAGPDGSLPCPRSRGTGSRRKRAPKARGVHSSVRRSPPAPGLDRCCGSAGARRCRLQCASGTRSNSSGSAAGR